jgi:hypothetical protein
MGKFIHIFTEDGTANVYMEYDDIQSLEEWATAHRELTDVHIEGEKGTVAFAAVILRNRGNWKNVIIH